MGKVKRVVIGPNEEQKSAVIHGDSANEQQMPGIFWRSTLWATTELPVDNAIKGDRAVGVTQREPEADGLIFRALEIPPDIDDRKKHIEILQQLHEAVNQKHEPSREDMERHPSMHRTDTLDMFTITRGEIYLVTDTDEVLLKSGDSAIVQGVNHAWSNRSSEPCMIMCVMVHARA
ncbi:MAG TPA: cupin domain-containing protein [Steroidobacteraceae bacterium]|jgi:mannose-6-phosphate isomerase-like protein (cupin superfamily)